jgi:radical SAM protein with 4Fe4S-binding SPASM domain
MTRTQIDHLLAYGVSRVIVSLDASTKEIYERIKLGAKWEKVMDNIRYFVALRTMVNMPIPELWFRFVAMSKNIHEIEKYPALIEEIGIPAKYRTGMDNHMEFTGLLEFPSNRHLCAEIPQCVVEKTNAEAEKRGFGIAWSHASHTTQRPIRECVAWQEPYILVTGHVMPCCQSVMSDMRSELERMSLGNIKEQSLHDIWYSEKYRAFRCAVPRSTGPVPELCSKCRVFNSTERVAKYGLLK